MPWAKTTRGQPKNVRCPHCGKKFCTETNVLQHLNQPLGSCFGKSLFKALIPDNEVEPEAPPTHHSEDLLPSGFEDLPWAHDIGEQLPQCDKNIEMDDPHAHRPVDSPAFRASAEQTQFMEMFEGCGTMYPGGKTFMGVFREDRFAEQ